MGKITLNAQDRYLTNGKFFEIKKGKILVREILTSGKIITYENCLKQGELVGNFFNFLPKEDLLISETETEIEALVDGTIIEEFQINPLEFQINPSMEKMINQLIKNIIVKFFYQVYDTKGYILAILTMYSENGIILKKQINYENFVISKSQFYVVYTKLKEENFLKENNKIITLNLSKIKTYLKSFEL